MIGSFVTQTHNIGVPIEQRRGIEHLDLNDYLVLVQAPIEQVGQALCQTRQVDRWERDVYGREIEIVDQHSAIIFQFRRHPWTIIQSSIFFPFPMSLHDEDAQSLSRWLQTKALSYLVSDTGGYIGYHYFNCGESLERFYYDENELIEVTDADANEMEFIGVSEFRSQLRPKKAGEIDDGYRFINEFLREQDAYVPACRWGCILKVGQKVSIQLEDLERDDIERMDYITLIA